MSHTTVAYSIGHLAFARDGWPYQATQQDLRHFFKMIFHEITIYDILGRLGAYPFEIVELAYTPLTYLQ